MSLDQNEAKKLLESLYEGGVDKDADWSNIDDELLQKFRSAYESGDAAVQHLLATLAFNKFETAEEADRIAASMGGIKMAMVGQIFEDFPTSSLEDLKEAADKAGYDIEILS